MVIEGFWLAVAIIYPCTTINSNATVALFYTSTVTILLLLSRVNNREEREDFLCKGLMQECVLRITLGTAV